MRIGIAADEGVVARDGVGTVARSSAIVSMFSMGMNDRTPLLTVTALVGTRFRLDYADMLGASINWQALTNFSVGSSMTQMT